MKNKIRFLATMLIGVLLSVNQVWGDTYTITFKTASSDGSTEISNTTQVGTVISSGTNYVSGFTSSCSKAYYSGKSGVKLGSSSAAGTLEFNIAANYQSNVKKITVVSAKYSSDSGTLTLYSGSTSLKSGITPGTDYTHTFTSATTVSSIKISTSTKRAYVTSITLETEAADPVTSLYLWEAGVKSSNLKGDYKVGAKYTLPSTCSQTCGTKTFVGWSTVEIQNPGAKPTSNYYDKGAEVTLAADNNFYAVFADAEEGGGEEIVETVGFESSEGYTATSTYNSGNYTTGSNGSKWTINYGAFATSGAIVGSQSAQFRIYGSGGGYGQLYNTVAYTKAITKVTFSAKAANTNGQVKVSYSTAGTSWTDIETKSLTATTTEYTVTVPVSGVKYIKFTSAGTKPSSGNYSIYVDAVKIYSSGGTSYSNYTTTCGPSTYTVNFSGQKSGHLQPSFLALSQIVIWGFFAFFL